jgi:Flp pilus assembly protein TadD
MFTRATELTAQDHRVWGNLADALWQIDGSRAEAQSAYRRAIAPACAMIPKCGATPAAP